MRYELDCDGLGLKLDPETEGSRRPLITGKCFMNMYANHNMISLRFFKSTDTKCKRKGSKGKHRERAWEEMTVRVPYHTKISEENFLRAFIQTRSGE